MKDLTHNHVIMYSETYSVYCKLIIDNKLDIKTILVAGVISGDIVNKL